jgi:hypothetical protein
MPRGRTSRALTPHQIERLDRFRRSAHDGAPHGYSFALLRTAMGARFSPETMQKALQGRPIWVLHHSYIVEWIERYLGKEPAMRDGKAAASGERDEDSEATGAVRRPMDGK